jgi:hypothetical protein
MNSAPTREDIERLAYRLWLERGCPAGTPEQDWDRAEQMLRSSQQSTDIEEAQSSSTFETARSVNELPQATPIDVSPPPSPAVDSRGGSTDRKPSGGKRRSRNSSHAH